MTTKPWLNHTVAVLCALALFPACAKKKDEKKTEQPAIETPKLTTPGLATDYSTGCIGGAGSSSVEVLRFTDTEAMRVISDSSGDRCADPTATTRIYYSYKIGAHRGDRVFDLDFVEKQYLLTPHNSAVVGQWNRIEKCGIRDWAVNEEKAVRKNSFNCLDDQTDGRPVYTVLKVEGDRLSTSFDTKSNRNQDGLIPERRILAFSGAPFTKLRVGSDAGCPAFAEKYACSAGDSIFEGRDIAVSVVRDPRMMVQFVLTRPGNTDLQRYFPGDQARVTEAHGLRVTTSDSCHGNALWSSISEVQISNPQNRTSISREFRINDRGNLVITTITSPVFNGRPERETRVDTVCEKR